MLWLSLLYFLIHQSQGYSVKMQGKVEVGQELAVIFQNLFDHYLQNSKDHTEIDMSKLIEVVNALVVSEPDPQTNVETSDNIESKGKRQKKDGKNKERHERKARREKNKHTEEKLKLTEYKPDVRHEESREKTFLEEIAGKQEKVHVYGKHAVDKKDMPFNNINV